MDLKEALSIVIDLGRENVMDDFIARQDSEVLMEEKRRQEMAVDKVCDPLFGVDALLNQNEQLGKNVKWMVERVDKMHAIMCYGQTGTWQIRTNQLMDAVEKEQWSEGVPPEAMWCLATYLTADDPPSKAVAYLWFNPDAIHKWWKDRKAGKGEPLVRKVTHWKPIPPPAGGE